MKKIILVALAAVLLLSALLVVGCQSSSTTEDTTTESTTSIDRTHETPNTSIPDLKFQKDLTTLKEVSAGKPSETVEKTGYTAQTTEESWSINSGIDYSVYDYIGSGSGLVEAAKEKYEGKTISYYSYDVATESRKKLTEGKLSTMSAVMAFYSYDSAKKIAGIYIQEIDLRVRTEYTSVDGKAGYFMTVPFNTNLPGTFSANISATKGSSTGAAVSQSNIVASGKDGTYKGAAKMTIPFVTAGDYYVNIFVNENKCVASVPIKISDSEFTDRQFHLLYTGDWDLIRDPAYQSSLTELFYNTYARLYARWGTGSEPKTITFTADPTYDGVAYAMGTQVVVSVDYANSNPKDKGFFSHEITHSVQQFNFYYGDGAWWTENMANYGGFRYYHWSSADTIQLYQDANQNDLYNWNWGAYGDGSKWFFAYLDDHWPTTKNADGSLKLGLIDRITKEIKTGVLRGQTDDPFDTTTPFNKIVKEITGFDCMEDVRKQYEKDFRSKAWDFKGFADYTDNFLTEGLADAPDPDYPMVTEMVHGEFTADPLDTVVTGDDNLCLNATIHSASGQIKDAEGAAMMLDGKDTTKWCVAKSSNLYYCLDGTKFWAIIDLGETKSFDTYTLFNTKVRENLFGNMSDWEIFVSDDAKNWTSVDYQTGNTETKVSFNIGEQSARYVMIKVYNGDGKNGTLRLYEFQLYNTED